MRPLLIIIIVAFLTSNLRSRDFVVNQTSIEANFGTVQSVNPFQDLNLWYSLFLQDLSALEIEGGHMDKAILIKTLNSFGSGLIIEITPAIGKTRLVTNVIAKLGDEKLVKVTDMVVWVRKELEALVAELKTTLEKSTLERKGEGDTFVGINRKIYMNMLKLAVVKNRFDEYRKEMVAWKNTMGILFKNLSIKDATQQYKTRDFSRNVLRFFKFEHDLIDFKAFQNAFRGALRKEGDLVSFSYVQNLFLEILAKEFSEEKLLRLYQKAMEKGTFEERFDTLEIALPRDFQIEAALRDSKYTE